MSSRAAFQRLPSSTFLTDARSQPETNEESLHPTPARSKTGYIGLPPNETHDRRSRSLPWRAFSLRPLFLIFLACLSLFLLAIVEYLRRRSHGNGGLYSVDDTTEIPSALFVAYNYVPIPIAIIYTTLWLFVDTDVKRLEPYFQMSSPRDVPVDILLIDYLFEYSFLVPFHAIKRRHWTVALMSTVSLLISVFLPPLLGSFFSIESANAVTTLSFDTWQMLDSIANQSNPLRSYSGGEVVNYAGSVGSAGAALPEFVTAEYAIAPFDNPSDTANRANETWTAESVLFWAEPFCQEVPSYTEMFKASMTVQNSSLGPEVTSSVVNASLPNSTNTSAACVLTYSVSLSMNPQGSPGKSGTSYWPLWVTTNVSAGTTSIGDGTLQGLAEQMGDIPFGCTNFTHLATVVKVVASPLSNGSLQYEADAIGILCGAEYFSALGQVTVYASNSSVLSANISSPVQQMDLNVFNPEFFESNLGGGLGGEGGSNPEGYTGDNSSIMSALPLSNRDSLATVAFDALSDPSTMNSSAYTDALLKSYKLSFALALPSFMNLSAEPSSIQGSQSRGVFILVTIETIAILSEVILGIAAAASLALVVIYRRRNNILSSDPDSLAALCSLVAGYVGTRGSLMDADLGLDTCSTARLEHVTKDSTYHWRKDGHRIGLESRTSGDGSTIDQDSTQKSRERYSSKLDPLPFFITAIGFCVTVSLLLATIVGCGVLLGFAYKDNGYSFLAGGSTSVKTQVVWSFAPTLVGTLIESMWIANHRDFSMLEPWVWLRKGFAPARSSLSLRYSSRPPLVVLFNSLKQSHFLLALVSAAAISTSLLNIAMGGLFSQSFATVQSSTNFPFLYGQSELPSNWDENVLTINTAFDLVRSNITEGTAIPPWTSDSFSFVPVEISSAEAASQGIYQTTTPGVGVYLLCDETSPPPNRTNASTSFPSSWSYSPPTVPGQANFSCEVNAQVDWAPYAKFTQSIMFLVPSKTNGEDVGPGSTSNSTAFCRNASMVVSERWGNVTGNFWTGDNSVNVTALACQPQITAGEFNVTFNSQGQIQSYSQLNGTSGQTSFFQNMLDFLAQYHSTFGDAAVRSTYTLDQQTPYDWPGLLTARLHWISSPNTHLEEGPVLSDYSNRTYSRIFSQWFSTNRDQLLHNASSSSPPPSSPGTTISRQARMVPSLPLFIISFTLLTLYIFAAVLVLSMRRHRYAGPRMPKSLGSIIPWIAHSRFLRDFQGTEHMSSDARDLYFNRLGKEYGFGWFKGVDGKVRLGVEEEPLLDRAGESEGMEMERLGRRSE